MKKRVLMTVLCFVMIFPMVVYGQDKESKIIKNSYEIDTDCEEIAMEYMADAITDKVLTWQEDGVEFTISPFVQKHDYGYTKVSCTDDKEELVVGYAKNESGTYTIIQLLSEQKITKKVIYSYFE